MHFVFFVCILTRVGVTNEIKAERKLKAVQEAQTRKKIITRFKTAIFLFGTIIYSHEDYFLTKICQGSFWASRDKNVPVNARSFEKNEVVKPSKSRTP